MFKLTYCYDGKRTPSKAGTYCCIMRSLEGELSLSYCEWRHSLVTGNFRWLSTGALAADELYPYAYIELTENVDEELLQHIERVGSVLL